MVFALFCLLFSPVFHVQVDREKKKHTHTVGVSTECGRRPRRCVYLCTIVLAPDTGCSDGGMRERERTASAQELFFQPLPLSSSCRCSPFSYLLSSISAETAVLSSTSARTGWRLQPTHTHTRRAERSSKTPPPEETLCSVTAQLMVFNVHASYVKV